MTQHHKHVVDTGPRGGYMPWPTGHSRMAHEQHAHRHNPTLKPQAHLDTAAASHAISDTGQLMRLEGPPEEDRPGGIANMPVCTQAQQAAQRGTQRGI